MQHLAVKATVAEVTDLGEFTAIAATYDIDRVKDQIVPGAFKQTIERWRRSGKRIPVHWNHSGDARDIIGSIDPAAMRETDEGLYVAGKLDLHESEVAREAWRSMRSNAVSLSFGYKVDRSHKGSDGVTMLDELDLFEISVTAGPANPETRFLSLKAWERMGVATTRPARVPTNAELRARAKALGVEPPLSKQELRQHSDEVRLEVTAGASKPELHRMLKDARREDEQRSQELRDLRRRSREVELEAALDFDADMIGKVRAKCRKHADLDLAHLRANSRELMLRTLLGDDRA